MIDALLDPRAVTVVGASPNGYLTEHLLRNLANHSCRYAGPVTFVNPGYNRLFGRPCLPSVADVEGEIGVLYLLVALKHCLPVLRQLRTMPQSVVLFAEASRPGDERYEDAIAQWGRDNAVPVLGPQSNGLVTTGANLLGLLVPVVEDLTPGSVALLAQSGGILGGLVKHLAQRRVGLHSALEYGTGAMLSMERLGLDLLDRPDVRLVGVYADGIGSVRAFDEMLRRAAEREKPVVFMIGGRSVAGRRAAASHSGMATTPTAVLSGLARQHGALSVATLDELVWSVEAIAGVGFRRHRGAGVALFSDSGGGNVSMADALSTVGVGLVEPTDATKASLELATDEVGNPFDFGSTSMGETRSVRRVTAALSGDDRYGVCAYASILGVPRHEQSVHLGQLEDFATTVREAGKVPFVASVLPFLPEPTTIGTALIGMGSIESAVKLRALGVLADDTPGPATPGPEPDGTADLTGPPPVTGEAAERELASLPVTWPVSLTLGSAADLPPSLPMRFPVVAKSEAGLPHRVKVGGVLHGISSAGVLATAVTYLVDRFAGPVSVVETVPHDDEFFVGAYRSADLLAMLFGPGGGRAEQHAEIRVSPVTQAQLAGIARWHATTAWQPFADLLGALQDWMIAHPDVESVDLNPVVVRDGMLVALDGKIQRRRAP